eukprot:SAG22_NODE_2240_length_2803_cov_1.576923_2_plen_246_part_00
MVTADLHSCQQGWSYDNSTGQIKLAGSGGGCITVPAGGNASLGSTYYDDAALVLRPCIGVGTSGNADLIAAQQFDRRGDAYVSTSASSFGLPVYVRPQPWWEGAGVQLSPRPGGQLFFVDGRLQSGPGRLRPNCTISAGPNHCEINPANAVCMNGSPTMDQGASLLLWAKQQPKGAVAVFLLNNHPTRAFTDVAITIAELGLPPTVKEVAVRDVWRRADAGSSTGGVIKLSVPARDSALVVLTPH